jgi:uncharacterized membrane protein YdbT with pleckstrin-like domain
MEDSQSWRATWRRSWRRAIALGLALLGDGLVLAWASYLIYWGFIEEAAPAGAGLTDAEHLLVAVVIVVPSLAALIHLLATFVVNDQAALFRWISAGAVGLFVLSPGLLGLAYLSAFVVLTLSAALQATPVEPQRTTG